MAPDALPAQKPASPLAVHATLFAVQVAFASLSVAGKVATETLAPEIVSLVRVTGAALVFGALYLARHGWPRVPASAGSGGNPTTLRPIRASARIPLRDLGWIAVAASLGVAANQLLFLSGLKRTHAINATVIGASIPVFTVAVSMIARQEQVRLRLVAGVLISLSGIVYLVGDVRLGGETALGDALIVANSLCYAVYLVLARGLVARYGPELVITLAFVFAVAAVAPFALPAVRAAPPITAPLAWLLVYIVLSPTVFTYLASAWALGQTTATVVAIYIYIQPIFATIMAMVFLGERLNDRVAIAAALVFAGIALVSWRRRA